MFKKLDHVGVAVNNLEKAMEVFHDVLGLSPTEMGIFSSKEMGVRGALLPIGNNSIELLEPIDPEGRIGQYMKAKGEGLFHLTIFADDFDAEIAKLEEKGYQMEKLEGELFPGFSLKAVFLSPEQTLGVPIEIVDVDSLPPGAA